MPEAGAPVVCGAGTELQDTDGDGVGDTCMPTEPGAPTEPGPQIACGPGTTQQGNACVPVVCPPGFTLLPGHQLADAQGCVDFWADADNDGIPDAWEADNGLDRTVNDRNQDLDKDGCSNLTEFIMGTNPNDPTDGLCLDYWRPYPPF